MKRKVFLALLFLVGSTFIPVQAQQNVPVAGKDYIEIPNGSPLEPADGKVVVEEYFNYICPACSSFEPLFAAWARKLPSYVKLEYVPAAFRADFAQYARAYYAAQSFGLVDKTHEAVYRAIHHDHSLPAEGDKPDDKRIAAFYSRFGVDAQKFLSVMQSFGVDSKIRRVNEHMRRSKIPSTPSIVINGRYLVKGNSFKDKLRIADYLIKKEHSD